MKRIICLLMCALLLAVFSSCGKSSEQEANDARILEAIDAIKTKYTRMCADVDMEINLHIIYTRLINVADDADLNFENIDYVVEFQMLFDHDDCDYDILMQGNNYFVVYEDGKKEIDSDIFKKYQSQTYCSSFDGLIESVENFEDAYNRTVKIN